MIKPAKEKFFFLGLPGSGKGTQGLLLAQHLQVPFFSVGDLLRERAKGSDATAKNLAGMLKKGGLLPGDFIVTLLLEHINQDLGFVVDGVPRTLEQKHALFEQCPAAGESGSFALFLDVPEDLALQRLLQRRVCHDCGAVYSEKEMITKCQKCGSSRIGRRSDDVLQTIEKRFSAQKDALEAVIASYEKDGLLKRINGAHPPDQVHLDIIRRIAG